MAWIRWRETKRGVRLATVQWRDAAGRVRSKALKTDDERLIQLHLRRVEAEEEGRPLPAVTVDAGEALERFLAHVGLTREPETESYYRVKLEPLWEAWRRTPLGSWDRPHV